MAVETIKTKRGLDLPITGTPRPIVARTIETKTVAVLGEDFAGLKPAMLVKVGERVKKGQPLFTHRNNPGVNYTAPASGVVKAINRGVRRVLQSVVIERSGDERAAFTSYRGGEPTGVSADDARALLQESGLWVALRSRPYAKVPDAAEQPRAILVNAMDTNPLAADPMIFVNNNQQAFKDGLSVLAKLAPRVHVCAGPKANPDLPANASIRLTHFDGPHPAGLSGTHIHFLEPLNASAGGEKVWTISAADTVSIGHLFRTGELKTDRIISIGGPMVKSPALYQTHLGACISELCQGLLKNGQHRLISGSVFSGHAADEPHDFLGRYHLQVSVIQEGGKRELLGWKMPGLKKFSVTRAYVGAAMPFKTFDFNSLTNGSPRAIVPVGIFEKLMPLDTEPTFLARALASHDVELAVSLGALELDEEDVGLLSFGCPGKHDYGVLLREILTMHERDG